MLDIEEVEPGENDPGFVPASKERRLAEKPNTAVLHLDTGIVGKGPVVETTIAACGLKDVRDTKLASSREGQITLFNSVIAKPDFART